MVYRMKIFGCFALCVIFGTSTAAEAEVTLEEVLKHMDHSVAADGKWRPLTTEEYKEIAKEDLDLANQGNAKAQAELAELYRMGLGVVQDYSEALKWCRLAVEQDNGDCAWTIGIMNENGTGVVQNYVRAHMWYNVASANGDGRGARWRDKIAIQMTREDISKAQEMARVCISSRYKDCGW